VLSINIVQSSGSAALDAAARRGVAAWRFAPARRANGPVASSIDIPIQFKLNE
jgi:periplasmic protein TonB